MPLLDDNDTQNAHLRCPITHGLIQDPVTVPCCGRNFGRNALGHWLQTARESCPLCNAALTEAQMRHNPELAQEIAAFSRLHPQLVPAREDIPAYNPWAAPTRPTPTTLVNQPHYMNWEERVLRGFADRLRAPLGVAPNSFLDSLYNRALEHIAPRFRPTRTLARILGTDQNTHGHTTPRPAQTTPNVTLPSFMANLALGSVAVLGNVIAFAGQSIFNWLKSLVNGALNLFAAPPTPAATVVPTPTPMPLFAEPTMIRPAAPLPPQQQQRFFPGYNLSRPRPVATGSPSEPPRPLFQESSERIRRDAQLEQMARELVEGISRRFPGVLRRVM